MSTPGLTKSQQKKAARTARHAARALDAGMNTGSLSSATPIPADVDKSPEALVKLACKLSLDSGMYVDTRFFAFSRRKESGVVFAPRAVYANSWIMRAKLSNYFEPLLRGGYKGSSVFDSLDSPFPASFANETDGYDYDSDSDIEDEDEDDGSTSAPNKAPEVDKQDGEDPTDPKVGADDPTPTLGKGQTLLIRGFAYPTWKAFIFYLYTGEIFFSPLRSQIQNTASTEVVRRRNLVASAPPCSPKSMYRLADQLGFEELKKKAQADMKSKLTRDNVLEELFSTIASRYDAIRDLVIDYACTTARDAVSKKVLNYMTTMDSEELKRSSEVIAHLLAKLASGSAPDEEQLKATYCNSCHRSNPPMRCGYCNYNL